MNKLNREFVLIYEDGERLYPYKKKSSSTGKVGYVVGPPGLGDKKGNGEYFKDIESVLKKVLFDDYSVRAQNDWQATRSKKREGSYRIGKKSIRGYELDASLYGIVADAAIQPAALLYSNDEDMNSRGNASPQDEEGRIHVSIKSRRGQPEFRRALLEKYRNSCCISGTKVEEILEAAHIVPHSLLTDFDTDNGLLLRADIHTLFDLELMNIAVDGSVVVSEKLEGTEYEQFSGVFITGGVNETMSKNLQERRGRNTQC
jgi:hypothetical protein